jgi:hypothetical protein
MADFIAAQDGTVMPDPGQAPSDPARRPGQPGAERQPVGDTPPEPVRGPTDDRGTPVDGPIGDPPADDQIDEPDPGQPGQSPPLSDGSVRAGPV